MDAQPIVLLNGWPGVGKDTIAETLSLLIGDNKASLLDWGKGRSESFQTIPDDDEVAQKAQRDACLANQVEHPSTFSKMVICTDCLSDTPLGMRLAQDFETVAKRTNRLLIPIYLECQVEENMRRLQEAERRVSLKDKSKFGSSFRPWCKSFRPQTPDCKCSINTGRTLCRWMGATVGQSQLRIRTPTCPPLSPSIRVSGQDLPRGDLTASPGRDSDCYFLLFVGSDKLT